MLYRDILKVLGFYLWIFLIPLAIPTSIAIYTDWIIGPDVYPQLPSAFAFLITMGVTALLGLIFWFFGRKGRGTLFRREGLLLVIIVYFLTSLIGGLPFWINHTFSSPIDAFFEAVSGFTTTGATLLYPKLIDPKTGKESPYVKTFITGETTTYKFYGTVDPIIDKKNNTILLSGIEAVAPSLLFWRSFMQCLGGGGIIVLFVAILPALGVGGKVLYQTEVTGPAKESIFPRVKETASLLWKVYLGLIILQIFLMMITNDKISLFQAITVSFSTLSTGGFTPMNEGIISFHSNVTHWLIFFFMILGSINFTLYFMMMRKKFSRLNDPELKVFLAIILFVCAIATWKLYGSEKDALTAETAGLGTYSFMEALQYGSFQTISAMTSTGFAISNFNLWPFAVQVLMLILFYVGGMAGSTAGGIKIIREQTFFRIMINKVESIFRPDTVRQYRIGNSVIDPSVAMTVLCFILIVAFLSLVSTFALVLDGVDPETSLSTIGCMINNVGIAFRMAGPTESFAFLSLFGKLLSCFLMIAGRLEFYAILLAFVPAFWRRA